MSTPEEYKKYSKAPLNTLPQLWPLVAAPDGSLVFRPTAGPPVQVGLRSRRFMFREDENLKPFDLFKPMINTGSVPAPRWIHFERSTKKASILIFADGAAPNNGNNCVTAGCGVVFRPDGKGSISFPLERIEGFDLTNNRAEIRAAYAALNVRYWLGEGFHKIVVATDSEYLVRGISEYVLIWKENGWKTVEGEPVKNQDLWKLLLEEIEGYEKSGVQVQFWLIPREYNHFADEEAKKAAKQTDDIPTKITDIFFQDVM